MQSLFIECLHFHHRHGTVVGVEVENGEESKQTPYQSGERGGGREGGREGRNVRKLAAQAHGLSLDLSCNSRSKHKVHQQSNKVHKSFLKNISTRSTVTANNNILALHMEVNLS